MSDFNCKACKKDFEISAAKEKVLCKTAIKLHKKKNGKRRFLVLSCKHCSESHTFPDDFEVYSQDNIDKALKK